MKFNNKTNYYIKSFSQIHITIINVQQSRIEIKVLSYMDLFPLHPRTRKPRLGSSLEWQKSVVEGPP